MTKRCPRCRVEKPLAEFRYMTVKGKRYPHYCTPCDIQYRRDYRALRARRELQRIGTDVDFAHELGLTENQRRRTREPHRRRDRKAAYMRDYLPGYRRVVNAMKHFEALVVPGADLVMTYSRIRELDQASAHPIDAIIRAFGGHPTVIGR